MKAVIGTDLARATLLLSGGELVAIPTETVYGLAANAFDADAVLRIFRTKQRPAFDPLIVHVHDRAQVEQVVVHVHAEADALMDRFWPGPLTLVLPKSSRVPDIVTSGLDTVGVRMPSHAMALELLRSLDFPLAAPSANPFGYVSPTTAQHVAHQLGEKIPYILDGGPCSVGVESTIVGWEDGRAVLYRAGGVPVEAIEEVLGTLAPAQRHVLPVAPGMIESHYAPRKPLLVGDVPALLKEHAGERCAVIAFNTRYDAWPCETLSFSGDPDEAARNLFAAIRTLDAGDAEVILAEVFPDAGLGRAINDRLRRAAAKR
jgi:L-threonylcarbamoyladenylate synthase